MKQNYFTKKVLMNDDKANSAQFTKIELPVASCTWNKFPGFLSFYPTYDEEEYAIMIHHHAYPENECCYSVTIGLKRCDIDLATDEVSIPLETLIGNVIGAILTSNTILEFTATFELFTGVGFHKF